MSRHPKHDHADNDRIQRSIDTLPEQRCEKCGAAGARWRLGSLMCAWCAAVSVVKSEDKTKILNTMVDAQRLADAVVDAAIDWHKSDMEESMDAAQTLEDAIEELLEFRRKMSIVSRDDCA